MAATQLLILLSSLTSLATSSSSPIPPITISTCTKTNYPDICYSSVQPYIRSVPHIDTGSILAMLVRATKDYTKTTREMAAQIHAENNKEYCSLEEARVLGECEKSYDDALESLQSAMGAVKSDDTVMANYMISYAVRHYGICRQGYLNLPRIGMMVEHDEMLVKMATNCLDVLNLL